MNRVKMEKDWPSFCGHWGWTMELITYPIFFCDYSKFSIKKKKARNKTKSKNTGLFLYILLPMRNQFKYLKGRNVSELTKRLAYM